MAKNNIWKSEERKDLIAWIVVISALVIIFASIIIATVFTAIEIAEGISNGEGKVGIPTLQLSFSLFFATIIFLAILFVLVYFLFWDKIKEHLEVRKETISKNISEASEKNIEAEKNLELSAKELSSTKVKAGEIIDASKKEASIERREAKEQTKKETDAMIERTREQIEREKKAMEDDIRNEIISTSMIAAEKIIEEKLDEESNKKMIEELIDNLK